MRSRSQTSPKAARTPPPTTGSRNVLTGSIYGFIGPNGSGKSITSRIGMHILLPDEATVEVLGSGGRT